MICSSRPHLFVKSYGAKDDLSVFWEDDFLNPKRLIAKRKHER